MIGCKNCLADSVPSCHEWYNLAKEFMQGGCNQDTALTLGAGTTTTVRCGTGTIAQVDTHCPCAWTWVCKESTPCVRYCVCQTGAHQRVHFVKRLASSKGSGMIKTYHLYLRNVCRNSCLHAEIASGLLSVCDLEVFEAEAMLDMRCQNTSFTRCTAGQPCQIVVAPCRTDRRCPGSRSPRAHPAGASA